MIKAHDIETLFRAQLGRIGSDDLRQMTVQVWVDACEQGEWDSIEEVTRIPFTLLTPSRGIGLVDHTIAVTEGAVGLAEAQLSTYDEPPYEIDMDILIAGGLLHDVGKLLEIEKDPEGGYRRSRAGKCARHPISGAILAAQAGLPDEIVNTIACHAKEGEGRPKVVETVLIHQADYATFDPLVMLEKGTLIR